MGKVQAYNDTGGRRRFREVEVQTQTLVISIGSKAKAGATAGWVFEGTTNLPNATLPASQTGSTLVIPIDGIAVGDMITGWALCGQVESAGGNVTVTGDLRKMTNAAADNSDASVSSDASGTLTADTILSATNVGATGLTEIAVAGVVYYLLVTATTAASTDIDLTHVLLTIQHAA